jgi:hypothetical protein
MILRSARLRNFVILRSFSILVTSECRVARPDPEVGPHMLH